MISPVQMGISNGILSMFAASDVTSTWYDSARDSQQRAKQGGMVSPCWSPDVPLLVNLSFLTYLPAKSSMVCTSTRCPSMSDAEDSLSTNTPVPA